MIAVGVDVGGTTIAAGAVRSDGEILAEAQTPTPVPGTGGAMRAIIGLIEEVRRDLARRGMAVAGIGLGVPGIVDAETGRVGPEVPHVPELAEQPLAQCLTQQFGLPVFVDNDVNALGLAEWRFGRARGATSLVVLAAGTGFGAAVVLDGRLIRGAGGFAGEFGHAPVKFDGEPCWCGGRGCLALYASGRGIAEAARARVAGDPAAPLQVAAGGDLLGVTAPLVFRLAETGDPVASAVVEAACRALGAAIATVVNGLNPDVVVVTGGVAASFARLERRVLAAAADYALARALAGTRVTIVPGDKRVTIRGAAALVFYERERRARAAGVPVPTGVHAPSA